MIYLELPLIALLLYVSISLVYYTLRLGISPIPTSFLVRTHILALAQKHIARHSVVSIAELGSGWGSLAIPLAKQFPTKTVFAYEASFVPYWFTAVRLWISPLPNLLLQRKNFYDIPLSEFDLFVCYLYPGAMKKLRSKFEQELMKPTAIITHTFTIPTWNASQIVQINDVHQTKIYLYTSQT